MSDGSLSSSGSGSRKAPARSRFHPHHHYFARVVRFDRHEIRAAMAEVSGINAKLAVVITRSVGTMACAYLFALIALISLPAAISTGSSIVIIAWIAQTFLQLVLLSVIMVGQRVQAAASEARATQTFQDTETILDRLDINTEGGLKLLADRLDQLEENLGQHRTRG